MPVWTPPIGGTEPLPPVKQNPRFADVPSRVHSGWTCRRQVADRSARYAEGGQRNKGENFRRITVRNLHNIDIVDLGLPWSGTLTELLAAEDTDLCQLLLVAGYAPCSRTNSIFQTFLNLKLDL